MEYFFAKKTFEVVSTIIIDQISNCFDVELKDLNSKHKLKRFKKNIKNWCQKYYLEHDGSILTEGRFVDYLEHHTIIERMLIYSQTTNTNQSEKDFISSLIIMSRQNIEGELSIKDELVLKELFQEILFQIDKFWIETLSDQQKTMLHHYAIQQAEGMSTLKNLNSNIEQILNDGKKVLSEVEAIEIYTFLNEQFWKGDFDILYKLLPCIEGRNDSVEEWLKYILSLALSEPKCDSSKHWKITIQVIKEDCVRKGLLFSALKNQSHFQSLYEDVNDVLLDIVESYNTNNLDKIFNKNIEIINNTEFIKFSVPKQYSNELWLIKRLIVILIKDISLKNIPEVINGAIQNESDFLIDLLITDQEVDEKILGLNEHIENLENSFDYIWKKKGIYLQCDYCIQKYFFKLCLNYAYHFNDKILPIIVEQIPDELRQDTDIEFLINMVDIKLGKANFHEIMSICQKNGKYYLLNNYFAALNDPQEIINLIDSYSDELLNEALIFIVYIKSLIMVDKNEYAFSLLKETKDKFKEYIDYWIIICELEPIEENLIQLKQLWLSNKGVFFSLKSDDDVVRLLYKNKDFKGCIEIINVLESRNRISQKIKIVKSKCFLGLGQKIDALNILMDLYNNGCRKQYVLEYIVIISLELKRDLPIDIISELREQNTSYSFLLIAKICEREGKDEDAKNAYSKSLLLEQEDNPFIYGNYLSNKYMSNENDTIDVIMSGVNTVIYLASDKKNLIFAIVSDEYFIKDNYSWNNALFISKEKAIQMRLLRRHVNNEVTIDGETFSIQKIVPVDFYLCEVCLSKLISAGQIKTIHMTVDEDEQADLSELKQFLRDEPNRIDFFEDYKDFNKVPIPLFTMGTHSKLTPHEFISLAFDDESIVIREDYKYGRSLEFSINQKFILSYSAVVLLFKLNINISTLTENKNVFIPKSMIIALQEEKDAVIKGNNRDTVASIGLVDDNIIFNEADEELKQQNMKFSIDFYNYCNQIPTIENNHHYSVPQLTEEQLINLFGIVDFDILSIASENKYILVSIDPLINRIPDLFNSKKYTTCNILELLNHILFGDSELIESMEKLVRYKMRNVLNETILERIINSNEPDINRAWNNYLLAIQDSNGLYRGLLTNALKITWCEYYLHGDRYQTNERIDMYNSLIRKMNLESSKINIMVDNDIYENIAINNADE